MTPYPAYKPSGIDWIGDIPKHWELKKIKHTGKTLAGGTPATGNPEYWNGDIPWLNSGKVQNNIIEFTDVDRYITQLGLNESATKMIKPDSVLMALTGATCANIGYLTFPSTANQSVVAIENDSSLYPKFLFYYLLSQREQILIEKTGGAQSGINEGDVKNIFICFPPITEQTAIASYLDEKTAQIDALITNKQKLIEYLKEELNIFINKAITEGVFESVEFKNSEILGLPRVPKNWKTIKLKYVSWMQGGFAFSSDDFVPEGVQLIKIANLYQNKFNKERQPTYLPENYVSDYPNWVVNDGDILMSMTGTLGKRDYGYAIQVKHTQHKFLLNQRVSRIKFDEKRLLREFGLQILRSTYYQDQLFILPSGTKQGNISNDNVLSIPVAFPDSLKEQTAILDFIQKTTEKNNLAISKIEKEIELMYEYRTALISEVVTGKIKVQFKNS